MKSFGINYLQLLRCHFFCHFLWMGSSFLRVMFGKQDFYYQREMNFLVVTRFFWLRGLLDPGRNWRCLRGLSCRCQDSKENLFSWRKFGILLFVCMLYAGDPAEPGWPFDQLSSPWHMLVFVKRKKTKYLSITSYNTLYLDCQSSNLPGGSRSQYFNQHLIQGFASPAGSRDDAGNVILGSEGVIWRCLVQRQTHRLLMAWGLYCKRCPPDTLAAGETQIDFLQESTESLSGGGPL